MRTIIGASWLCAMLAALPLAAANSPAKTTTTRKVVATREAWPKETLSGTISMVSPDQKVVVIQTSSGVPFDLVVTPGTRIKSNGQPVSLNALKQDTDKNVSVTFTPERRGDVARSIQITG